MFSPSPFGPLAVSGDSGPPARACGPRRARGWFVVRVAVHGPPAVELALPSGSPGSGASAVDGGAADGPQPIGAAAAAESVRAVADTGPEERVVVLGGLLGRVFSLYTGTWRVGGSAAPDGQGVSINSYRTSSSFKDVLRCHNLIRAEWGNRLDNGFCFRRERLSRGTKRRPKGE